MKPIKTINEGNEAENERSLVKRLMKDVKGSLTTLFILGIIQKFEKSWGYQIKKELRSISGSEEDINDSSLYTVLRKLEQEYNILESTMVKRRRFYSLTDEGKKDFDNAINFWLQLINQSKEGLMKLGINSEIRE